MAVANRRAAAALFACGVRITILPREVIEVFFVSEAGLGVAAIVGTVFLRFGVWLELCAAIGTETGASWLLGFLRLSHRMKT
jgi:hypothetical protein